MRKGRVYLKTIIVDDDPVMGEYTDKELQDIPQIEILSHFENPKEALGYAGKNQIELAILDIEMPQMNGIELSKQLRTINPDMAVIFLTAYEEFAMEAIKNRATAYVLKPYSMDEMSYAIETAVLLSKRNERKIYARTFGNFDLFVDGQAVMFKSAKAKELLAFLVDRQGGTVNTGQIIATLWEDRPNDEATQSLCSKITKTLQEELNHYGIGDILVQSRGVKRVDCDKFDCDLYELLNGKEGASKKYLGEYMSEYGWAEERAAILQKYL